MKSLRYCTSSFAAAATVMVLAGVQQVKVAEGFRTPKFAATPTAAGRSLSPRRSETALSPRRSETGLPPRETSVNLFSFGKEEEIPAAVAVEEAGDGGWTDFGKDPLTYGYAAAWAALVAFAFAFAPGELQSASDAAMLQSIIANPQAPDMNPFYYGVFNLFALIPIVLGCTIGPRANDEGGVPSGVAVFLSSFIAYFVMGPYLALRKAPRESVDGAEGLSWVTRNVWENKAFNYGTVAFGLLCLASGAPGLADPKGSLDGALDLVATSRFASVSMADLSLITLILTKEVADDYKIRCDPENVGRAGLVGASTALLPILGAAIYCAARPSLED